MYLAEMPLPNVKLNGLTDSGVVISFDLQPERSLLIQECALRCFMVENREDPVVGELWRVAIHS